MRRIGPKWRPGLGAVILVVLGLVLCLPIAGLSLFRFYANQLVQQTEESLLMQASVLTAAYEQLYRDASDLPDAPVLPPEERSFQALFPSVTMNPQAILPPRPDAQDAVEPVGEVYAQIGPQLSQIALRAQQQSPAGYRILDRHGTVIGGSAEEGAYLGHVGEVALALNGEVVSVARTRVRESGERALYTFSPSTRVRIFVAMPAMVDDDIIGVVYLSRTPNHIFRFLYGERWNLVQAALFVLPEVGALDVTVSPPDAKAPLPGDVLAMALTHLLENAADHGATRVQITVDVQGMTLADDGNGISEGNRARVFEPFFTTRRAAGGTGMGLNIVRSAIEAAGGRITLEPSQSGAAFRIAFEA